jgi:hypothetical protein
MKIKLKHDLATVARAIILIFVVLILAVIAGMISVAAEWHVVEKILLVAIGGGLTVLFVLIVFDIFFEIEP